MLKKIVIISLFLMAFNSYATLNLVLTKGIDSAIPIAVVPFANVQKAPLNVSQIIISDLTDSGQFNVMPVNSMRQKPTQLSSVNFNYWKSQKLNDLVIGQLQAQGANQYKISFTLLDVYKGSRQSTIAAHNSTFINGLINPMVVKKSYYVKRNELRAVSHRIADLIYQQLTGVKGIFSTKIAYVLVQRPQGKKPIYSLVVADADGHNAKSILISHEPIMSPAWSPNNKKIAYVSFEHRRAALYVSNVATGKRRVITEFAGINGAPAFSPEGKRLAVVLSKDGSPHIYIIDLRTGALQQATKGWSIDTEPAWAPNGRSLIFTSNRGGGPQIYEIDLMTGRIQQLTFDGRYNASASFSPDGKSIVFLHRNNGQYNIALQNLEAGDLMVLTHSSDNQSPSISPNGKMVIYAAQKNDQDILALVSIDGRVKLTLPESRGEVYEPAWSGFY